MQLLKLFCILLIFSAASTSYALSATDDTTLVLTVINHSSKTLSYSGVTKTNPGNTFSIPALTLVPDGAVTIIASTSPYTDLQGELHFRDEANHDYSVDISDQRFIHYSHPRFKLNSDDLVSFTDDRTLIKNESENPTALSYTAATMVIEDNI